MCVPSSNARTGFHGSLGPETAYEIERARIERSQRSDHSVRLRLGIARLGGCVVGVLHRLLEIFRIVEGDFLNFVSGARAQHQVVNVLRRVDRQIGADARSGGFDRKVRSRVARIA